ncbi:Endonuclease/exonuclease/phosphatase [Suillus paluster]|uniref:Endonuclease/exonuclease/phosphatase n=1 Tax=Suillus paluster TaxID=48578 RepID=UPI001B884211|nr:Endonuclease/exonuclease/phosphatase [Suillus paluster]KAG1722077.1 Endonuclease/exonuclease/phosphatase [Suillus paluster]
MLKNLNPETYDLACIQEPYLNPVNLANASNLRRHWDILYPSNHHANPERSQTIILINKRISKNMWHIVPINSPNIMAIDLTGVFSKVHVYNVYNPCDHNNTLHYLERHMRSEQNARRSNPQPLAQGEHGAATENIIWMGDFNHHHPMWEPISNNHLFTAANLDAAGVLINLLALYDLVQVLPPGLTTLEASNTKNLTRPDNVFFTAGLEQVFTACKVEYQLRPVVTDHFPIISSLDLQPERIPTNPRLNY